MGHGSYEFGKPIPVRSGSRYCSDLSDVTDKSGRPFRKNFVPTRNQCSLLRTTSGVRCSTKTTDAFLQNRKHTSDRRCSTTDRVIVSIPEPEREIAMTLDTSNLRDRRTEEQKETHTVLLGGFDKVLSGWRCNEPHCDSWAFWACRPEDEAVVREHVERRTDLVHVYEKTYQWIRKKSTEAQVSIYPVTEEHGYLEET